MTPDRDAQRHPEHTDDCSRQQGALAPERVGTESDIEILEAEKVRFLRRYPRLRDVLDLDDAIRARRVRLPIHAATSRKEST
jgi:hypothetical protein